MSDGIFAQRERPRADICGGSRCSALSQVREWLDRADDATELQISTDMAVDDAYGIEWLIGPA